MADRIQTYAEFWPYYLSEHRRQSTRVLHVIGTTLGVSLGATAVIVNDWRLAPAALVCAYGFAWFSHFVFEKNRPASFKYPFWSLISDFRMLGLAFSFGLGRELRRCGLS